MEPTSALYSVASRSNTRVPCKRRGGHGPGAGAAVVLLQATHRQPTSHLHSKGTPSPHAPLPCPARLTVSPTALPARTLVSVVLSSLTTRSAEGPWVALK